MDLTSGATEKSSGCDEGVASWKVGIALDASCFGVGEPCAQGQGYDLFDHMCLRGMFTTGNGFDEAVLVMSGTMTSYVVAALLELSRKI